MFKTNLSRSIAVCAVLFATALLNGSTAFAASGPDISVSLTNGVTEAYPGGTYIYTATISNLGGQKANSVVVTQQLPSYVTFLYIKNSGTANASNLVTWPAFSLNAGETVVRQLQIQINNPLAAGAPEKLTSTATATASGDTNTANNSCTYDSTLIALPDLCVTISDGLTSINTGPSTTMAYTVNIANYGTCGSTGIVATVPVPANTTVVAGSISNGGFTHAGANGLEIIWPAFALNGGGASTTRSFTLKLNDPLPAGTSSTLTTTVSVADDASNGPDANLSNNSACDVDCIKGIPPVNFDLGIEITDGLDTVNPGATMLYTVDALNVGNVDASNVLVKATIPANTSVVAGSISNGGSVQGNFVVWPTFYLVQQTSTLRQFTLKLVETLPNPAPTHVLVTATISGDAGEKNLANNTASDCDKIIVPPTTVDLAINQCNGLTDCAPPGSTVPYILTICNLSSTTSTGIIVSDTIPPGTDFVSASDGGTYNAGTGKITWPAFSLNGGESAVRSFIVKIKDPVPAGVFELVNIATVADDGSHGIDRCMCNNTTVLMNGICTPPDLKIVKTLPVPCVTLGANLVYTLTASSLNAIATTGVVITDAIPANTTFVSASDGGTFAAGVVTFPAISLAGNASVTRTVTVKANSTVPAGVTTFSNTAYVTDDGSHGKDKNPNDNTFTIGTPICSNGFDLSITADDPSPCAAPGTDLTYTLTVSCNNVAPPQNVVVRDTIPMLTTFVSASDGGTFANGVVTFPAFALQPNTTITRTLTVHIADVIPDGTVFSNNSSISLVNGDGSESNTINNVFNNQKMVCQKAPDLAITKSVPVPCVTLGANLTYTLVATSKNSTDATGVVVSDKLPANTTYVSSSNGGTFNAGTGVVTFPAFSLAGNSTAIRTITVAVAPTVPQGVVSFINVASVSDDGSKGPDVNPNDNTFTLVTPKCSDNPSLDLKVVKYLSVTCLTLGSDVIYDIVASNESTVPATGVVVVDTLPANVTFVSATGGGVFSNGKVTFPAISLGANSTTHYSLTVHIPSSVPAGVTTFSNVVSINDDGNHGPDVNPTNNTYTLTTPICTSNSPDLNVSINSSHICANGTDTYTYVLKVANGNGGALSGILLTDTIPSNSTFVSASDGGTFNAASNTVTFPTFNLPEITTVMRTVVVSVAIPLTAPATPISLVNNAKVVDDGSHGADANINNNVATSNALVSNLHFVSDPTGQPNPVVVGVPEVLSAVAVDDANPNVPVTYTWDFGDGSTGTGSTVSHIYTVNGPFTITVTVSNGIACPIGFTLNRDSIGGNGQAAQCQLFKAPFSLVKPNADSLTLVAQVTLPKGFNTAGQTISVNISNFAFKATLDKSGKGIGLPKNQSVKVKANGDFSIVSLKVTKSNLRTLLAPGVPANALTASLPKQLFIIGFNVNGNASTFGVSAGINYKSNGKTGVISF